MTIVLTVRKVPMPVSPAIQHARQARYERRMKEAEAVIPAGPYCYRHTGRMVERRTPNGAIVSVPETIPCPYYKLRRDKPVQRNGYCRLLKAGDWMSHPHGTMLLWDGCKECGINVDDGPDGDSDS